MFIPKEQRSILTDLHSTLQEQEPKLYINYEFKTNGFFSIVKNEKGSIIHNINVMEWEDDAESQVQGYQMKLAAHVNMLEVP